KVKGWFTNNGRRKDPKSKFLLLPNKLKLKTVIAVAEKEAIEEQVRRLSGAHPGSKEYMAKYQMGLSIVTAELSSAKRVEYQRATDEWEEKGYPEEVKRRFAQSNLKKFIEVVDKYKYQRMGACGFSASFHTETDGRMGMSFYDNIGSFADKGVVSFEKMFPEFVAEILEKLFQYATYFTGVMNGTIPAEVHVRKQRKKTIERSLGRSKDGYPIFNALSEGRTENLKQKKDIIRAFLNQHYGM
ncbi:hypothetical protein M413DRAFT_68585, partial [Hebeloma cylindrosporum]